MLDNRGGNTCVVERLDVFDGWSLTNLVVHEEDRGVHSTALIKGKPGQHEKTHNHGHSRSS